MTKRHNMTKGERNQLLEKKVSQLEMSTRVAQMLIQQIGNSVSTMSKDIGELAHRQRELQYRVLAVQELGNFDIAVINKKAEELQIKDFTETSDKEDKEGNYTVTDTVTEDSVVILTTKTPDTEEDKGILRSKLLVAEIALPELKKELLGKKVGDTFGATINNIKHDVTVLGVRLVPPPAPKEEANVATAAATAQTTEQTAAH